MITFQSLLNGSVQAQSVTQATITEILDGNQVYIQERQAQVDSVARQRQRVRTAASRAALSFNTGAVARLAQNSSLTVGQCAQLQRGTVLVNGRLNGCAGSTVAGVRGTIYTLTIDQSGAETLAVYEGTVEVTRSFDNETERPENPQSQPIRGLWERGAIFQASTDSSGGTREPILVGEGQSLTYDPVSRRISIRRLTEEDFQQLLTGPLIDGYSEELPDIDRLQNVFEELFPNCPFPLPSTLQHSAPSSSNSLPSFLIG